MDAVRGRFKTAAAMLGLLEAYAAQQGGDAAGGLQF
jgi:hypothetical protein